ncbi:MAG TPA: hypothetical protein VGO47_05145 [Chlamydiales bacterium]|nr:hypothetical protein [Chlamydiales bacterium]
MKNPAPNITPDTETRVCQSGHCSKQPKPITDFPCRKKDSKNGKKGERGNACQKCMEADRIRKRKRKKTEGVGEQRWEEMQPEELFEKLAMCDTSDVDILARVNLDELVPTDIDDGSRARAVALMCDEIMSLHWT